MTVLKAVDSVNADLPDTVQKIGAQFAAALGQGQKITLDIVDSFAEATSFLGEQVGDRANAGTFPTPAALVSYNYDLAIELLTQQKKFVLALLDVFTPKQS